MNELTLHIDQLFLDMHIGSCMQHGVITPMRHIKTILGQTEHYFIADTAGYLWASQINVKSLITNAAHDGIWLVMDTKKDKLSIPGGNVIVTDIIPDDDCRCFLDKALARNLYEMMDGWFYDDGIHNHVRMHAFDYVLHILSKHGFTSTIYDDPLYIDYPSVQNACTVYVLIEVDYPVSKTVALQPYVKNGMFLWYSREDHLYNRTAKRDRKDLFPYHFHNDIRLSEDGVEILDKIFLQEGLFGKMGSY